MSTPVESDFTPGRKALTIPSTTNSSSSVPTYSSAVSSTRTVTSSSTSSVSGCHGNYEIQEHKSSELIWMSEEVVADESSLLSWGLYSAICTIFLELEDVQSLGKGGVNGEGEIVGVVMMREKWWCGRDGGNNEGGMVAIMREGW